MADKQFHITGLLIVLISLSLSFSTVHNHEVLKNNHGSKHHSVEHSISKETSLCPICGYLFHADFTSGSPVEFHVQIEAVLPCPADPEITSTPFTSNQKRGPPQNA